MNFYFKEFVKNRLLGKDIKDERAFKFVYSAPGYKNHAVGIFCSAFCPQAPDPEPATVGPAVDQGPSAAKLIQSCLFYLPVMSKKQHRIILFGVLHFEFY